MALGHDYELQDCPIARALELVGERWTLLVIRDCFVGVSRFNCARSNVASDGCLPGETLSLRPRTVRQVNDTPNECVKGLIRAARICPTRHSDKKMQF
jgi:hypothetical protein